MGIMDRLGLIVRSNVNSFLDKSSNPEADLNMYLLDMQSGVGEVEKTIRDLVTQEKMYEIQAKEAHTKAQDWDKKAQTAVRANRDDLATEALRQKLSHEQDAERFAQLAVEQRTATQNVRSQLEMLKNKLTEVQQNKANLIAQYTMNNQSKKILGDRDPATGLSDSYYDKMVTKINAEEIKAQMTEDQYDSALRAAAVDAELNKIETNNSLEDELSNLKSRMAGNTAKPASDNSTTGSFGDDKKPGDRPYKES